MKVEGLCGGRPSKEKFSGGRMQKMKRGNAQSKCATPHINEKS